MKKISIWANAHVIPARILLIISKIILAILGYIFGQQLLSMDIILPDATAWIFFFVLAAVVIIYPRKSEGRKHSYIIRKSCDLIMAAGTFVCIATICNNNFFEQRYTASNASTTIEASPIKNPTAAEILESLKHRDKSTLTRKEKRILKQEFKVQLKKYVVAKVTGKKRDAEDTLLIMLTIIGALGLLYLVAALACGLSCNGADAAAVVVIILGVGAVVWGTIAVINKISRKHSKRWEPAK